MGMRAELREGLWYAHLGPMMLPPVSSPVPAGALAAAAAAALGRGSPRAELEALLLERFAADAVMLCDSGTHALQVALSLAIRETGKNGVALPAYSCYDVATAGLAARARLEFYDISPETLAPEPESLTAALARGVAAVVVVHAFGIPVDIPDLRSRVEASGAVLIEDAAQGHGGSLGGRPLGSLGTLSVLSFGRGKGWTGGGGGALLARDGFGAATRALPLPQPRRGGAVVLLARLAAQGVLGRPVLYGLPSRLPWLGLGETRFAPPSPARAMGRAAAAAVMAADAASAAEAAARRRNAAVLRARLTAVPGLWLPSQPPGGGVPGYLRLPVRKPGVAAEEVVRGGRSVGVLPSYPRALSSLPEVAGVIGTARRTPGADALARELFTVPVHRWVDLDVMERIAGVLTGPA